MLFNNIESLKNSGFEGFEKIGTLTNNHSLIPKEKGVYLVLNPHYATPQFVKTGTGGHFKGKNPNVPIEELQRNWVENALVVYIGKAGGEGSRATLHTRLRQYLQFGKGNNIGHWGGRLIWQLAYADDLIICWKKLPYDDPRSEEKRLLQSFIETFHKRPLANLTG
jgi:hypothetical protein